MTLQWPQWHRSSVFIVNFSVSIVDFEQVYDLYQAYFIFVQMTFLSKFTVINYLHSNLRKKRFIWELEQKPTQTTLMKSFGTKVNSQKPLTVVAKLFVIDIFDRSRYALNFLDLLTYSGNLIKTEIPTHGFKSSKLIRLHRDYEFRKSFKIEEDLVFLTPWYAHLRKFYVRTKWITPCSFTF